MPSRRAPESANLPAKSKQRAGTLSPALLNEITLLDMIYRKFYAQQRTQRWFKYLQILRRRLLRFVQAGAVDVRGAEFVVRKLVRPAAVAFQAIIAQGAFITLGFALIALLARVHTLLRAGLPARPPRASRAPAAAVTETDDLGETVDTDENASMRDAAEKVAGDVIGLEEGSADMDNAMQGLYQDSGAPVMSQAFGNAKRKALRGKEQTAARAVKSARANVASQQRAPKSSAGTIDDIFGPTGADLTYVSAAADSDSDETLVAPPLLSHRETGLSAAALANAQPPPFETRNAALVEPVGQGIETLHLHAAFPQSETLSKLRAGPRSPAVSLKTTAKSAGQSGSKSKSISKSKNKTKPSAKRSRSIIDDIFR